MKGSVRYRLQVIPASRYHIHESDANENLHEPCTSKGNIHNWGKGRWGVGGVGDSPSNTDMKQHFLYLIINIIQCTHIAWDAYHPSTEQWLLSALEHSEPDKNTHKRVRDEKRLFPPHKDEEKQQTPSLGRESLTILLSSKSGGLL